MLLYLHRNETGADETDHDYILLIGDPGKKVVAGPGKSMPGKDVLIRPENSLLPFEVFISYKLYQKTHCRP